MSGTGQPVSRGAGGQAEEVSWRPVWEDEAGRAGRRRAALAPAQPGASPAAHGSPTGPPCWRRWPPPRTPSPASTPARRAASPALREGLVARLAFAEAAGWLAAAADRAWIHPRDLALAEAGLLGDFSAAALGGRGAAALPATSGVLGTPGRAGALLAEAADRLPDGATLAQGLALARALRRLASTGWDPLASPEAAAAALAPLSPEGAGTLRLWPERFAAWRSAALAVPRPGQSPGLPPLLTTATAAAAWLTAEALEDSLPTPAQALLLAAAVARRRGRAAGHPPALLEPGTHRATRHPAARRSRRLAGGLPEPGRRRRPARPRRTRPAARGRGGGRAPGGGESAEPAARRRRGGAACPGPDRPRPGPPARHHPAGRLAAAPAAAGRRRRQGGNRAKELPGLRRLMGKILTDDTQGPLVAW